MSFKSTLKTIKDNKGFLSLLIGIIAVKSSIIDWNYVPTGSMRPTLADGDQIIINKLAYDLTIPLTYISLHKFGDPVAGDIVVFDTAKQDVRMVKRVVAVPGDKIKMRANKVYINDEVLGYKDEYNSEFLDSTFKALDEEDKKDYKKSGEDLEDFKVEYKTEIINGVSHGIRIETGKHLQIGTLNFQERVLKENEYFMVGDNRNNSFDSRFWGFVERDEIIGKVNHVVFSLDQDHWLKPRINRFFADVE